MNPYISSTQNEHQRGSVLVLVAVSLTVMLIMLAFAFDYGRIVLTKSELQAATDAAALAGASQLMDEDAIYGSPNIDNDLAQVRDSAETFALLNAAANVNLQVDRNDANLAEGGVVVGFIDNPSDRNSPFLSESINEYNSVQVKAGLTNEINGPLGLFLGGIAGIDELEMTVQSTATLDDRIVGFAGFQPNQHFAILPFSLDVSTWDAVFQTASGSSAPPIPDPMGPVVASIGMNALLNWFCAPTVVSVPTVKIFPYKTETPGNFGSIDIGSSDNSTSVLCDQILYGPTAEDIALIGGLTLTDEDGDGVFTKWFNGDTGMSAAVKSAIEQIYYQPRILPLHKQVIYNGNNAMFEVCRYVGVKVVDMKMTGAEANRYIQVEPAQMVSRQAVINPSAPHSRFVYALSLTR